MCTITDNDDHESTTLAVNVNAVNVNVVNTCNYKTPLKITINECKIISKVN